MPKKAKPRVEWKSGNISGSQIVIGEGNNVIAGNNNNIGLSEAELKTLQDQFSDLTTKIEASASPEKKKEALQKAKDLQKAVLTKKPDPSNLIVIRDWFVSNLPGVAGTVTGVLVNPIVGKLVQTAGDLAVKEFQRKVGAD